MSLHCITTITPTAEGYGFSYVYLLDGIEITVAEYWAVQSAAMDRALNGTEEA
jgi:hypothetical protein